MLEGLSTSAQVKQGQKLDSILSECSWKVRAFYSLGSQKCGSPISRSSITWELIRSASSWDPAQTYQIRDSGRGAPAICAITNPSGISDTHSSLRNTAVTQKCCFLRFQGSIYAKLSIPLRLMLPVTSSTNWIWGRNSCWGTSYINYPLFPQPIISIILSESLQGSPAYLPTTGSGHASLGIYAYTHVHNIKHILKPEGVFPKSGPDHVPLLPNNHP